MSPDHERVPPSTGAAAPLPSAGDAPRPPRETWIHAGRDVGTYPHAIPPSDAFVRTSVTIPMRDGTRLRGDLHVPPGDGPFPAVVEITPYGAQGLARLGRIYAARGLLFLGVDCRGRYRSEGRWDPLSHDREDGHDVLAWVRAQPLCNGRLGTRGHSYAGFDQLLAAVDAPPGLQAMVVGFAPGDPFVNTPFQGGAYDLNDLFWLLDMSGRICSESLGEDGDGVPRNAGAPASEEDRERDELIDAALDGLPFGDVDLRLGTHCDTFREWVSHWRLDEFWKERAVAHRVERTDVPTLHLSGWWDGNGAGATTFFRAMRRRARSAHAREHQRLLLGPWDHDVVAPDCSDLPPEQAQAIRRGALRDPLNDELAWFDRFLLDAPAGASGSARVTLFVTGLGRWIDLPDWPVPGAREEALFLDGEGERRELRSSPPAASRTWTFRFDPGDPTPFGPARVDGERAPFDAAPLQAARDDLLVFDGAPLAAPLAVIGPVRVEFHAAASTPDFDLCAALFDVHPDGRAIFLADGILRARFRGGFDAPRPVVPGEPCAGTVDLWHLGHVFGVGHRVRLQVAGAAHLRFDLNPCTGGDLATDTERRATRITLHGGRSRVVLPVVPAERLDAGEDALP